MRKPADIQTAEQEHFDKVWYGRKQSMMHDILHHGEEVPAEDIYDKMRAECERMEAKYGMDDLMPADDFEWGVMHGKLSALRWVLGDDWDNLDT